MSLGDESVTAVEARALGKGGGAAAQSKQLLKRKSDLEESEPRTHGHGASSSSMTRNYGLTSRTRRKQEEIMNRDRTDRRRQEKLETGLGLLRAQTCRGERECWRVEKKGKRKGKKKVVGLKLGLCRIRPGLGPNLG
ncbi:hypothetical protein CDL15_Pgr018055 [Punica granatum]|uniref:Uncharacterized protein n=1 Tax=Punica granatum TaxID=22663 RepID=A0A218WJF4_PUNGR|nr:hypothetical protein CDL15_Pgr018055 [Punica granatum]